MRFFKINALILFFMSLVAHADLGDQGLRNWTLSNTTDSIYSVQFTNPWLMRTVGDSYFHPIFTTRVQAVTNHTISSSTSLSIPVSPTLSGDLIVVVVACNNTNAPTITDSSSQTYSLATSISTGSVVNYIFYKANTGSGVTSVTVNNSTSGNINAIIAEYFGVSASSPFDQSQTNANTTTTTWTSDNTLTTAQTYELLIGNTVSTQHNNTTYTAGPGWNAAGTIANSTGNLISFLEEQYVNAVGTYAATGNVSQSDNIYAAISTFKIASNVPPTGFTFLNSATTIKTGSGILKNLIINTAGTGSANVKIYDGTNASGTIIGNISLTANQGTFTFNSAFSNGLTILVNSNTSDFTITYD